MTLSSVMSHSEPIKCKIRACSQAATYRQKQKLYDYKARFNPVHTSLKTTNSFLIESKQLQARPLQSKQDFKNIRISSSLQQRKPTEAVQVKSGKCGN